MQFKDNQPCTLTYALPLTLASLTFNFINDMSEVSNSTPEVMFCSVSPINLHSFASYAASILLLVHNKYSMKNRLQTSSSTVAQVSTGTGRDRRSAAGCLIPEVKAYDVVSRPGD